MNHKDGENGTSPARTRALTGLATVAAVIVRWRLLLCAIALCAGMTQAAPDSLGGKAPAGSAKAKSIRQLISSDHYPDITWGIKLADGNVGFSNGILSLPQWTAFLLKRLLATPASTSTTTGGMTSP